MPTGYLPSCAAHQQDLAVCAARGDKKSAYRSVAAGAVSRRRHAHRPPCSPRDAACASPLELAVDLHIFAARRHRSVSTRTAAPRPRRCRPFHADFSRNACTARYASPVPSATRARAVVSDGARAVVHDPAALVVDVESASARACMYVAFALAVGCADLHWAATPRSTKTRGRLGTEGRTVCRRRGRGSFVIVC